MGLGPKSIAFLSPFQAVTGCGSRQRRSPMGGAAKGMPLKTLIPEASVPTKIPSSTLTLTLF